MGKILSQLQPLVVARRFIGEVKDGEKIKTPINRRATRPINFQTTRLHRYTIAALIVLSTIFNGIIPASGAEYRRIVSLAPSITKNVCLLGLKDRLAGITIYCPPCGPSAVRVGTILEPNIETIVTLKPDIVIATKEGNALHTVEQLRAMGINVFIMDSCNNFEDINRSFLALAHALGRDKVAHEIVANARQRVGNIRAQAAGKSRARIFWEVGAQPLFTVSNKSYIHFFMEYAGGENIFAGCSARYPRISREEVLRLNPDIIILVTMGDVTPREQEYWQSFPSLSATWSGRIYVLSGPLFTDPTPSAFAEGVEKIAALLHSKNELQR